MSDVIPFPQTRIIREVPPESIKQVQERGKVRHAEAIVDEVAAIMHSGLSDFGIDTEPEDFQKDFAFTLEGLKAIVFRSFGIEHQWHDIISRKINLDEVVEIDADELPCDVAQLGDGGTVI
jgi:hypothetical protein